MQPPIRCLSEFLLGRAKELDQNVLNKNAVIFAAHPDDETLGCGGTIIKKVKANAKINICFLTSGEASHSDLVPKEALKHMRINEALEASRLFGVVASNVSFLNLPDSGLTDNSTDAIRRVRDVLLKAQPDEIFIPSKHEPIIKDHYFANKIILLAAQSIKKKFIVNEYPVWLWCHFPWVNFQSKKVRDVLGYARRSFFSELNLTMNFHSSVYIGDVLKRKSEVLNSYKSQMSHLNSESKWRSLRDIGHGEFVNCFLRNYEIFYRYSLK